MNEPTPEQRLWDALRELDAQSRENNTPYEIKRINRPARSALCVDWFFGNRSLKEETECSDLISSVPDFYSLRCNPDRTKCNIYVDAKNLKEITPIINQYAKRFDKLNL